MSIINHAREIIVRDLKALKKEINETDAELLWVAEPGIVNSVGTLCFHICGNLNHFIGAKMGNNGYLRDRDSEFLRKDVSLDELINTINETISAVETSLDKLSEIDLENEMPEPPVQHQGKSIGFFLMQLCVHFARHRGQLDYLRRITKAKKNHNQLK